ncbi:tetratricopeptide repeat protein [Ferriphaselus sp. R-1]|uniref:tetratricopeptide repeat protein n=1 Tax=Ferriphaselus sp. R-1 TaxID=1485544 RepID=UPI00068CDD7A|nr:tetratricopeptide repeat protein [Ferriphaselus sp. R-1]
MAMIKCDECGKDISDKAAACVGCGAPITKQISEFEMLQKAAEQGDVEAQCTIGTRYETGDGVAVDYDKAIFWYQLAAENGHEESQYKLGLMCQKGQVIIDGKRVGDISGDGVVDYEDFKLAVTKPKVLPAAGKNEPSVGHTEVDRLTSLTQEAQPVKMTESQIKREKFKAALESTIDAKFANIMSSKSGDDKFLTYFDAQILTTSVRNIFKNLLQIVPAQIEAALQLSEMVVAPTKLEKITHLKAAIGIGGAVTGIGLVLTGVGAALGWGASAVTAFTTFFTGAHLLGPLAWAASGVTLAGFAAYFATTSDKYKDSEKFIKVLKSSTSKGVDAIWDEYQVELSKIVTSDVQG